MDQESFRHRNRNLLVLHFTVFVWGFTGILGALISVNATHLVWYRVLIAVISLWLWFKYKKTNYKLSWNSLITLFSTGAIVALHWILFFYAIKQSTVSVTLVCLSSLSLFTAFLEPLINRSKVSKLDIGIGLLIITGIYIIFEFESKYTIGIISGLVSAICASLFSIINSKQIKKHEAPVISFYELMGALVWISIFLAAVGGFNKAMKLNESDVFYLIVLGTICTSLAYVAGVSVMKELSAFRVALITNLEPIYGILLAFLFFGKDEQMSFHFYLGAAIILIAVFAHPLLHKHFEKQKNKAKYIPDGQ
ncbi:DMT family transporter [Desertivirga xinjiangensis]|uniref:DMT family transporter n=1 Tax=Desertivirga xinjiangensis TaxID=539206 RepID=UPI00210C496A|nr:EamA family transporter [Pedobacter xinjiangensis]